MFAVIRLYIRWFASKAIPLRRQGAGLREAEFFRFVRGAPKRESAWAAILRPRRASMHFGSPHSEVQAVPDPQEADKFVTGAGQRSRHPTPVAIEQHAWRVFADTPDNLLMQTTLVEIAAVLGVAGA